MKDNNEKVFASALRSKIEKSAAIGGKASWSTKDHLKAVAECLKAVTPEEFEDVLQDVYNISGFQQRIAESFKSTGHFQREGRKTVSATDLISQLSKEVGAV